MPLPLAAPAPLSRTDERVIVVRARQGDRAARDQLITHNLRLVLREVWQADPTGQHTDELFSVGCEALIRAADAFDPARGTRFSTPAIISIRRALRREMRRWRRVEPTVPLTPPAPSDHPALSIPAPDDTEAAALAGLAAAALHRALARLGPRDRALLIARYGLDGAPPLTQTALAAIWHCSPSVLSRREARVLARLRLMLAGWGSENPDRPQLVRR